MQDLRYALRTLAQAAHLHAGRRPDADARHRRQHRDLQPALPDPAAAAAVSRTRTAWCSSGTPTRGIDLPQASVSIPDYLDRKTQAPAHRGRHALHDAQRRTCNEGGSPEQLRGARGHAVVLLDARAPAVPRPRLHRRRGEARRRQVRHPDLRPLDVALRRGSRRSSAATSGSTAKRTASSACCRRTSSCRPATSRCSCRSRSRRQQMSDNGARQRVQLDDRAAAAGRDHRAGQRADEDDRRRATSSGCPARAAFAKTSGFGGLRRPAARSARRRRAQRRCYVLQAGVSWSCCSSRAPTSRTCC